VCLNKAFLFNVTREGKEVEEDEEVGIGDETLGWLKLAELMEDKLELRVCLRGR
jgi:hypothetical protein